MIYNNILKGSGKEAIMNKAKLMKVVNPLLLLSVIIQVLTEVSLFLNLFAAESKYSQPQVTADSRQPYRPQSIYQFFHPIPPQ